MLPEAVSGRSFRGCLQYVTHDKDAETTERVAWTEVLNLRASPHDFEKVAREMAWVWYNADALKRAAGERLTGRKMTSPVYHLMLAWHPSQDPSRREMVMAAHSLLEYMGLGEHQAYLAAHNDEPHAHLHIVVNKCHPVTGMGPKPRENHQGKKRSGFSNDRHLLQKWAYEYEKETGQIFCKERIALYDEDPEIRAAARREEYKKRAAEREGQQKPSRSRAQHWAEDGLLHPNAAPAKEIRKALYQEAQALQRQNKAMEARHKAQFKELAQLYAECKQMLWRTRGEVIGNTLDEMKALQKPEWAEFFAAQRRELREFERNESSLTGQLTNIMSIARRLSPQDWRTRALDCLHQALSGQQRMIAIRALQQQAAKAKAATVRKSRKAKIDRITRAHAEEVAKLRRLYGEQKAVLQERQNAETKAQRAAWRALSKKRAETWGRYKEVEQQRHETAQRARTQLAKQFHPKLEGTAAKAKAPQKAAEQNNTRGVGRVRTRSRGPEKS